MNAKNDFHRAGAYEAELNKERAGALGITARKLEGFLEKCQELKAQLEKVVDPALKALLLEEYRAARADSEQQRWNLCVQREAMGLRRHDEVDRQYPVAPKL